MRRRAYGRSGSPPMASLVDSKWKQWRPTLPSWAGTKLPERIRSTTFAMLGVTVIAGLGLVALFSQPGWPLRSLGPLSEPPPPALHGGVAVGHPSASADALVAVATVARGAGQAAPAKAGSGHRSSPTGGAETVPAPTEVAAGSPVGDEGEAPQPAPETAAPAPEAGTTAPAPSGTTGTSPPTTSSPSSTPTTAGTSGSEGQSEGSGAGGEAEEGDDDHSQGNSGWHGHGHGWGSSGGWGHSSSGGHDESPAPSSGGSSHYTPPPAPPAPSSSGQPPSSSPPSSSGHGGDYHGHGSGHWH